MKKLLTPVFFLSLFCSLLFVQCTPDAPKPEEEENLTLSIDPDTGSTIAKSFGSSYNVRLIVTSKMPAQGVTITVTYRKDADNTVLFSQSLTTTVAATDLTINNLVFNEPGTVTIQVVSKSKPTNTATKTFQLVKK